MKIKIAKLKILIMMLVTITGCSNANYQNDESFETDIIGTYEVSGKTDEDNEITYYKKYVFDNDDSYWYESNIFGTESISDGIYSVNNLTTNIIEIRFDINNTFFSDEDSICVNSARQYKKLFKYRNMLGSIIEAKDLPTSELFDYVIPTETGSGMVFSKDGYYHTCMDINNCQCDYAQDIKYIVKNDIIYYNIKESVGDDYWQIAFYIVDDYLFMPELYKIQ